MAKIHDKFIIELAEVIKGYGNDPDVEDPFCLSTFYRFYELPNIAVSRENFKKMTPYIEERKTGKWVQVHGFATPGGDPVWCCSECGKGVHVYGIEHGTYGADISDGQWKACPNCSALMEGEQA